MQPSPTPQISFYQSTPAKNTFENPDNHKKIETQGCDSSSDSNDSGFIIECEQDQANMCPLVGSPLRFDFCDTDPGKVSHLANSSLEDLYETVLLSPQGSEAASYASPDAVSISSFEDEFTFFDKKDDENGLKINDKIKDGNGEVQDAKKETEQNKEREECNIQESDSPLLNCKRDGFPLFVSSFDYHHKSVQLEIVNEYVVSQRARYFEQSPTSSCSSRSRSISCSSKHRIHSSTRSAKRRYHHTSESTRHSKHRCRHSYRRLHSYSPSPTHNYKHYTPDYYGPNKFYKPTGIKHPKRQASELQGFAITDMDKPPHNVEGDDTNPLGAITDNSRATSSKMIAGSYKCPECSYTATLNRVITHYCYRHFTITCPSCDKDVEEPFYLQHCKHCRSSKSKLECPNCTLTCTESSLLSLAMHVMCTHPTKTCTACGDDFIPKKFMEHAKICFFGPNHRYTCPFCECRVAATKLTEHIISHPIAECPLCYKDITYQDAEEHMEACYLEKVNDSEESFSGSVFNCPLCKHRLTFENMSHHIVLKHIKLNCVFCYVAKSHDEMKDHLLLCCQQHQNKSEDPQENKSDLPF